MTERGNAGATVSTLLDRRLVMVTGKGGTGKTTFAAALAMLSAKRGKTLLRGRQPTSSFGADRRLSGGL